MQRGMVKPITERLESSGDLKLVRGSESYSSLLDSSLGLGLKERLCFDELQMEP